MNIPAIPTDNLYKFIAIFGLVLYAITLSIPVQKQVELRNTMIQVIVELQILEAEVDSFASIQNEIKETERLKEFYLDSKRRLAIAKKRK